MVCTHLRELYQLCETHQLRLGGADLIRLVCKQCDQEETCPSVLMDEYDAHHAEANPAEDNPETPHPDPETST
ncbi:MAG: hypothetical protein KDA96_02015 [Planctomycetaceae bacterium]|nr:hypothetical protein [Planctomycetaceae bacterium]